MISRGRLLIVFSICFISCIMFITYEREVLNEGRRQMRCVDRAFEYACENASEVLKNNVYDPNIGLMVKEAFVYSFAAASGDTEKYDIDSYCDIIESISFSINGKFVETSELSEIKDSDTLEIYISLNNFCINSYGRHLYISRTFAKNVRK